MITAFVDSSPVLVWRFDEPRLAISSAPYGGGIGDRGWVLNATVPSGYDRLDPDRHIAEIARELNLAGPGIGLLTAVDVRKVIAVTERGVTAYVTTGVRVPTWAAAPDATGERIGTINAVCRLPVRLGPAALVNAVATVTEAKSQALFEAGVDGTGTATDAVVLLCPTFGPAEQYGGPRSRIGAALARAVHEAVSSGLR
ncbi:adenosylcobinamide amidohydrolase [Kutzneria buriramensis]|uniref:Adenosylcobinamide amidohydrolase n=1 Tax=Kutzneria buriramensis TaxID=1045776 RepID=A0A3E0IAQ1_9PSEU|nr:adenosylcobinamide amidohydrolase [Kutzneria buriramensis]REH55757.1 adenosylcobinamide amidohydrolase [Kutzneria buriramensis]